MASGSLTLLKCLHREFIPAIKRYGFKAVRPRASDDPERRNLILYPQYRTSKKVSIHTMDVQYDRFTGYFCVNFGIHFKFLPLSHNDKLPVAHRMDTAECVLQSRLAPEGNGGRWWPVSSSETETSQSVRNCVKVFERWGIAYFDSYGVLPGPYGAITINDLDSGHYRRRLPPGLSSLSAAHIAAVMAYVAEHLGRPEQAKAFADYALTKVDARFRGRIQRYLSFL